MWAALAFFLIYLSTGCNHASSNQGYLVTHSERAKYHHTGDLEACGKELDCDREEFRYTLVNGRNKYVVHCGTYTEDVNDCFRIQVGQILQCKFGAAFGDQWLLCDKYHLDLDSAERF
jgi:hypothetical protein